jgi:hypothetical protein
MEADVHKRRSMCPAKHCGGDNPVQVLIDDSDAEKIGHPALAGSIHCTDCGTVWLHKDETKTILGRFSGPIVGGGWTPHEV